MGRPRPPILLLLLALFAAAAWIQGLRAAHLAQERLLPARASLGDADAADSVLVFEADARFAVVDLGIPAPERVGLYRWMPARAPLRWLEPRGGADASWLVIPLEGLAAGEYAVCRVGREADAGPREMDRPAEELEVVRRFRLR